MREEKGTLCPLKCSALYAEQPLLREFSVLAWPLWPLVRPNGRQCVFLDRFPDPLTREFSSLLLQQHRSTSAHRRSYTHTHIYKPL